MKKKRNSAPKSGANVDRRNFVKVLPALGIASVAASRMPLDALAQTPTGTPAASPTPSPSPSPTPAPRITHDEIFRLRDIHRRNRGNPDELAAEHYVDGNDGELFIAGIEGAGGGS